MISQLEEGGGLYIKPIEIFSCNFISVQSQDSVWLFFPLGVPVCCFPFLLLRP